MTQLNTPYFLVDEGLLKKNLEVLRQVQQEAGCKILLAQKAFSMFACYPLHQPVPGRHHRQRPV